MSILNLIIAVVALVIAILAYHRAGGIAALKKQTEVLSQVGDSISRATDSLRDKTADILDKVESTVRGKEEDTEKPKTGKKKGETKK